MCLSGDWWHIYTLHEGKLVLVYYYQYHQLMVTSVDAEL